MKHEADQVLSEVTRKKSEAQRQINMLAALQKLRRIRAQITTNRGQHIDAESGLRFARVTGGLPIWILKFLIRRFFLLNALTLFVVCVV